MSLNNPLIEYYGNYADYVIVGASVDRLGILSVEIHVPRQDPVDWSKFNRSAAPTDIVEIPCVGVRLQKGKGDHAIIYSYDGKPIEDNYTFKGQDSALYDLEGTDSNEPIETHDQFLALMKKYGGTIGADNTFSGFPKSMPSGSTSQTAGSAAQTKNPLYGVSDYLNIGWIWSKSYTSDHIPPAAYKNAGCIDQPDFGSQTPIQLNNVRDWLRLAPRCSWRGNIWAITERWQASGRNGANRDIYKQISPNPAS